MGNNQERYIAGQTRYARNNPAGVKRSLYGIFRLFCNITPAIRRFRHLLKLLSFQTSSLVEYIIRKSKFPQNPKRSVRFSGKRTKRSVQKRKARNTQKAETKVL